MTLIASFLWALSALSLSSMSVIVKFALLVIVWLALVRGFFFFDELDRPSRKSEFGYAQSLSASQIPGPTTSLTARAFWIPATPLKNGALA